MAAEIIDTGSTEHPRVVRLPAQTLSQVAIKPAEDLTQPVSLNQMDTYARPAFPAEAAEETDETDLRAVLAKLRQAEQVSAAGGSQANDRKRHYPAIFSMAWRERPHES